jgi:hypothetical protein
LPNCANTCQVLPIIHRKLADITFSMNNQMVPIKKFAESNNIGYRSAYRYWTQGYLDGLKLPNGTIMVSGWKQNKEEKQEEVLKPVVLVRKNVKDDVENLISLAHKEGYSNLDIKCWNGKIYESNILLMDILKSGYNVFFIVNCEDAFGINGKSIMHLIEDRGVKVFSLNKPSNQVEESIYSLLVAVSKMLKVTVGMHGYKKEISEIINKIVS